ncbi:MAG: hypothetical protein MK135_12670 [Polyangiaceae bacterium]|nr:hypothetical protein [Polyangiaceae bacterium]
MTIKIEWRALNVPLGVRNSQEEFLEREIFLLCITPKHQSFQGRSFLAEAAPLPNYGQKADNRELVLAAYQELLDRYLAFLEDLLLLPAKQALEELRLLEKLRPLSRAAQCSIEAALLSAIAFKHRTTRQDLLRQFFQTKPEKISGPPFDKACRLVSTQAELQEASALGVNHFKLKLLGPQQEQRQSLKELMKSRPDAYYRIDANSCLKATELKELANELQDFRIEFWEDPLAESPGTSDQEQAQLFLPLALDEPLAHLEPQAKQIKPYDASFLIIKPMVQGSIHRMRSWSQVADQLDQRLVLSHFLDGPLSRSYANDLHCSLPKTLSPPGLGDHKGSKALLESSLEAVASAWGKDLETYLREGP